MKILFFILRRRWAFAALPLRHSLAAEPAEPSAAQHSAAPRTSAARGRAPSLLVRLPIAANRAPADAPATPAHAAKPGADEHDRAKDEPSRPAFHAELDSDASGELLRVLFMQ